MSKRITLTDAEIYAIEVCVEPNPNAPDDDPFNLAVKSLFKKIQD